LSDQSLELPELRERFDLDQAREDLETFGLYRLANALAGSALSSTCERLFAVAAAEDEEGSAYRYDGSDGLPDLERPNQRIWALLNKGPEFVDLALDSRALALMRAVMGPQLLLSNLSANITGPGGGPMMPHCDQQFVALSLWDQAVTGNVLWTLTDFTAENGATRVVPGSHRARRPPSASDMDTALPLEAPAGALIAFEGRLWHQTGSNTSEADRRAGLFAFYTQPWLRQQENWAASLDRAVVAASPPELRGLVGLDPFMGLGFVGGPPADMPRF
jgi:ectoine hydroxylase-related dioxygenase (phytanoyl-CoA dioxygenase family)